MEQEIIKLTLVPLVIILVQCVKIFKPSWDRFALPFVVLFGTGFSILLVDWSAQWQLATLALLTASVQVASMASGVYSWKPKGEVKVEIPDYSDSK